MNFIHIAGHLGADPEVRFTSSGKKVTTLRVAARARRGKNNDDTIWWRATLWGEEFDKMVSYLKKGSAVMVFGEIDKPEIFNDREGKPQISMQVTALQVQFSPFGRPASQQQQQQGGGAAAQEQSEAPKAPPMSPYASAPAPTGAAPQGETYDDEVPF